MLGPFWVSGLGVHSGAGVREFDRALVGGGRESGPQHRRLLIEGFGGAWYFGGGGGGGGVLWGWWVCLGTTTLHPKRLYVRA